MPIDTISLNALLGEEYEYCKKNLDDIFFECYDTISAMENCYSNIITLEAAKAIVDKKKVSGGTGPLPTNSKYDRNDFHSDVNRTIIVNFEEKIAIEKNTLWEHIKIFIKQVREWIESVVYKVISFIRQDKNKLNNPEFRLKLRNNISKNISIKTYPFKRAPEDIVDDCFSDIHNIINTSLSEMASKKFLEDNYIPFLKNTILQVRIDRSDDDFFNKLRNTITGGKIGSRPIMNAHITEESFVYFIMKAPEELKQVRREWHDIEKNVMSYKVQPERLREIHKIITSTYRSTNAVLSTISMLIFHMSSLMHKTAK
jgi:hypothetical protein